MTTAENYVPSPSAWVRRQVDTIEAALAGASDGELTVGRILDALAVLLDRDRDELATAYVPVARSLVREGFMSPR